MRERTVVADGIETWVRESPGTGTPVVFWHGNPTDADDWLPFMERLDRPSFAADMPAFGRTGAPDPGSFDGSVGAYGRWAESLLAELGVERYSLVVHDWGAIGLLPALRHPNRVESVVLFNVVPLGTSYRWHWLARVWRRRPMGEIVNALSRGPMVGLAMRPARPRLRGMPPLYVERVKRNWARKETRAAVLALYRSADPAVLEELGRGLAHLDAPALLLWARRDPYIGAESGRRMAALLPDAKLEPVEGAGHWSWLDRPELIGRAVDFLSRTPT